MNSPYIAKKLKSSRGFSRQILIVGLLLIGFIPGQAMAQVFSCAPSLSVHLPPDPFDVGEKIRISANLGAGRLDDSLWMELSTFGYGLDCQSGQNYSNCTSDGNSVEFLGNITTNCVDTANNLVTFNTSPDSGYIDFTPASGLPIKTLENTTCNVQFDVTVTALNGIDDTITQVMGWTTQDSFCPNRLELPLVNEASSTISFDVVIPLEPVRFIVTKDFTDDNPMPVEVRLSCDTGNILDQKKLITDGPDNGVAFVITDYVPGDMNCDVTEVVPVGYDETYAASTVDGVAGAVYDNAQGCFFEQVEGGDFFCHITNAPDPVKIVVNKRWKDMNPSFLDDQSVYVTLHCDAPILNGEGVTPPNPVGNIASSAWIDPTDPGIWWVVPPYKGSNCWVTEVESGNFVGDVSDCDDLYVEPGKGDECTVYNTRLYEGIPTLSQYGLALLVLLMLGVGAVGFRRFV